MPGRIRSFSTLGVLAAAMLFASDAQAGSVSIPRGAVPEIDGSASEWTDGAATIQLAPDLGGDERRRSAGDFAAGDLEIETSWSWSDEGLHALVRWRDDQLDTAVVRYEKRTWAAPDGSGDLDRMYLFDHLVVRLVGDEGGGAAGFFYGVWLAPRVGRDSPYQWDVLRQGPRREPRKAAEVTATRAASRQSETGEVVIEALISWEALEIEPRVGATWELRLIAPDSDCGGRSLERKYSEGCLKRLAWIGKIELGG